MTQDLNIEKIPEEFTEVVGDKILSDNLNKNMQNGLFKVSWVNVKSALMSAVITAILGGAGYIIGVGSVFNLNIHSLVNIVSLSFLTAIVSLLKAFLTTQEGKLVGVVQTQE
tara:strand:+ start:1524 stop:1859 length:336 start_codon:yes stop_codon:yes gene_type:complete